MQPLREMVRQFSALIPLPSLVSPLLTIRCVKKMNYRSEKLGIVKLVLSASLYFRSLTKVPKWSPLITVNLARAQLSCHLYEEFAVTFSVCPTSYFLLSSPLLQRSLWQDVLYWLTETLCIYAWCSVVVLYFHPFFWHKKRKSRTLRGSIEVSLSFVSLV